MSGRNRKKARKRNSKPWYDSAWLSGLLLLAVAGTIYLAGVLAAELFTMRLSMVVAIAGQLEAQFGKYQSELDVAQSTVPGAEVFVFDLDFDRVLFDRVLFDSVLFNGGPFFVGILRRDRLR